MFDYFMIFSKASMHVFFGLLSWTSLITTMYSDNECGQLCDVLERAPVCSSNGITFQNECYLREYNCNREQIGSAIVKKLWNGICENPDHCPITCGSETQEICGTNGRTYKNYCELKKSDCMETRVEKLYDGPCRCKPGEVVNQCTLSLCTTAVCYAYPHAECKTDICTNCNEVKFYVNGSLVDCTGQNRKPSCGLCKQDLRPVCASDEKTYRNPCMMRLASCYEDRPIFKLYEGRCDHKCPIGVNKVSCTSNPCASAECHRFPGAKCRVNVCGRCSPVFMNNGSRVDCTEKINKPGTCPIVRKDSDCITNCHVDEDCTGEHKCCETACSKICHKPCPPHACPSNCKFGTVYLSDTNGCKTCTCAEKCRVPSCTNKCLFGQLKDDNGCQTCTCCPLVVCPQDCITEQYLDKGCVRCRCKNITCPSPTCPKNCKHGTKMLSSGACKTCTCRSQPVCVNEDCSGCTHGKRIKIDAHGCRHCQCLDTPFCHPQPCPTPCQHGYNITQENGCTQCTCKNSCKPISCSQSCPYGTEITNKSGCPSCHCKQMPTCPPSTCPKNCSHGVTTITEGTSGCKRCNCTQKPPCPPFRCPLMCTAAHEFRIDKNGCKYCRCEIACPKISCPRSCSRNRLQISRDEFGCRVCKCNTRQRCPLIRRCKKGCILKTDSRGCKSCNCTEQKCKKPKHCWWPCSQGYKRDSKGCKTCKCCKEKRCPMWQLCQGGYALDKDGCKSCKCKTTQYKQIGKVSKKTSNKKGAIRLGKDSTNFCKSKADGNYAHEDCSRFIACSNGNTHVMDCAVGLVWNPKDGGSYNGFCDWPRNVPNCQ